MSTLLPPSVQRQLDQVAAIESQMARPQETPPPIGVVVPAPETLPNGTVVKATPPAPAPAEATPELTAAPPAPAVDWEHKYKTIQGMYNAHVPRLQGQLKELQDQMDRMKVQLEKPAEPPAPVVDQKDADTFGADLVEMVARVTAQQFGPLVDRFDGRLNRIEQTLNNTTQVATMSAEQAFFADVTRRVPDWEAVNENPGFLGWLDSVDPVYGQPRQAALDAARAAGSAERVAAIFNAWKSLQPAAPSPTPSLANQTSPRAGGASQLPATEPAKPIITQKQIQVFYDDMARGRYRGRDAEAAQFESMINLAVAENRIR